MSEQKSPAKAGRDDATHPAHPNPINKKLIDNVDVRLEAFLGDVRMKVADLVDLKQDSLVTLGATLDQAVELRLNGIPVAKGELVAVGDNFGVRLTEISR